MPKPAVVEPTDAVVRVDAVTICGTDLHILKGDVPTVDHRIDGTQALDLRCGLCGRGPSGPVECAHMKLAVE